MRHVLVDSGPLVALFDGGDVHHRRAVDFLKDFLGVFLTNADLPADFTDATLVRLAERRAVKEILTVDNDFTVYRTLSGRALRNMFFKR